MVVIWLIAMWIRDCMVDPITKAHKNGYLRWCNKDIDDIGRIIFIFFLLVPFAVAYPNGWIKVDALVCGIGTWLWNYSSPAFGSRWCSSSNIVSIVILILVALGKK